MKVQAALALTEMVIAYESGKFGPFLFQASDHPNTDDVITVRTAVAPQVGKVVQDLLTLSDETDLDILNHSMEVMAEQFPTELLPVAAVLTVRLVRYDSYSFLTACLLISFYSANPSYV